MKTKFSQLSKLYTENAEDKQAVRQMVNYLLDFNKFPLNEAGLELLETFIFIDEIRISHTDKIMKMIGELKPFYKEVEIQQAIINALIKLSPEKSCFNLFYLFNQQYKTNDPEVIFPQKEFQQLCESRLEKYINSKDINPDIETAFEQLYSCWDSVDNENEVHLTPKSLAIIYKFILSKPKDYLLFIVRRRLISGNSLSSYIDHDFVFEPYTETIFNGWDNFEQFLEAQRKKLDNQFIQTIKSFYTAYKKNNYKYFTLSKKDLVKYNFIPEIKNLIEEQIKPE